MDHPIRTLMFPQLGALIAILMSFATASAQEFLTPTPAEGIGSGRPISEAELQGIDPLDIVGPNGRTVREVLEPAADEEGYRPLGEALADSLDLGDQYPAVLESTGTWLRRGLWYVDLDAVIMTRTWDSHGVPLMIQQVNPVVVERERRVAESSPSADGAARLALGRFLFRDQMNRDHNAEIIVFGGAEWVDDGRMAEENGNNIRLPGQLSRNGLLTSFDGAESADYSYSSRFSSFEWNYTVSQRMSKDRMELMPNGKWVRRAADGWTHSYLAGLRYFDLQDDFDWNARNIASIANTPDGTMQIRSSNNLFGPQIGHSMTYETSRWNISLFHKHGMMVNDARSTSSLSFSDFSDGNENTTNNFSNEGHENTLSYLVQAGVTARYHLRPNFSLRAGWELMYVTSVALAPNEITFDGNQTLAGATGDNFYRGFTFGTEYYW